MSDDDEISGNLKSHCYEYLRTISHQKPSKEIAETFQELFADEVALIILGYLELDIVMALHQYYPRALGYIWVTYEMLTFIDPNAYKYVRRLEIIGIRMVNDEFLSKFPGLIELDCDECYQLTDEGLKYLIQLEKLSCNDCRQITDKGLRVLTRLKNLSCWHCPMITGECFRDLQLEELSCGQCFRMSESGIQAALSLEKLDCSFCRQITDLCVRELPKLIELKCTGCYEITQPVKDMIAERAQARARAANPPASSGNSPVPS